MARYAIVVGGVAVNVIESTEAFAASLAAELGGSAVLSATAGPRYTYSGGQFERPVITVPVPAEVTMRQARLALLGAGLLDDVETAINAMTDPAKSAARIEWDYSNSLRRDHALVTALGAALGLTTEQVDALFVTAAAL